MRGDIQRKMIEGAIINGRESAKDFQDSIACSAFQYEREEYQLFFASLDAALAYVEGTKAYVASDDELKEHLAFLKNGTSQLLFQLQRESSKNLLPDEAEGAQEHNNRWEAEIHRMNSKLQRITGSMGSIRQSVEILMKYQSEGMGSPAL